MPNWKKVIVSGSDARISSLFTAGHVTASGNVSGSSASTASFGRVQTSVIGGNSPLKIESDAFNVSADGTVSGSSTSTGSFGRMEIATGKVSGDFAITDDLVVTDDAQVGGVFSATGNTVLGNASSDTHTFTGHITSSGHISGSSISTGSFGIASIDGHDLKPTGIARDQVLKWNGNQFVAANFDDTFVFTIADFDMNFSIAQGSDALDEIVISASRTPERIFESPVTVEKFSVKQIENTPSADFFNGLGNLRSINMTESGLVFNQVSLRGFADVYNEGLVTLVDGMNNQAPVFGFAFGNLIGLHQLDVQSVELLPGAASALYGADAYKGIMFINSKNPFDHEGISVMYRTGVTEQDVAGSNSFTDIGVRLATKLSDKWAIKATIAHKEGTDWVPGDYRHYNIDRSINTNENYKTQFSNYDGVNTEGERTFTTSTIFDALADLAGNPALSGFSESSPNYFDPITSPGYKISDLYGTDTYNTKGNFAIHYRPDSVTEISLQSLIGTGKAMLPTGGMMYNIDEVVVQQHKLDYKRGGLKARVYYTHEDAGDTVAGLLMGTAVANSMPGGLLDGYGTPYLQTYLGTLAATKGLSLIHI